MSSPESRLLALVDVPEESDTDWPKVCHTLSEIQPYLEALATEIDDIGWLMEAVTRVVNQAGSVDSPPPGSGPRHGIKTAYPIFSALAAQPSSGVDPGVVRKLQAIYLASAAIREYYILHKGYRSPLISASRSCRNVADGQHSDCRIDSMILEASTPGVLSDSLEDLVVSNAPMVTAGDWKVVRGLRALVRDVRKKRKPRTRRSGERRHGGRRTTVDSVGVSDGAFHRVYRYRVIGEEMDEESRAEMSSEGLAAVHETTRPSLYVAAPPSRNQAFSADYLTEDQANQRLVLRARSFKTAQQPVPNRRDSLHAPALALLMSPLSRSGSRGQAHADWVADTLLGFMLLTGCSVKDLPEVRQWRTRSAVPVYPPAIGIVLDSEEFVMPAARLPESWQPERDVRHHFRPVENRFFISIPMYLPVARHILDLAATEKSGHFLPPWVHDEVEQLSAELNTRISNRNGMHHTHLSANRISLYLWNAIHAIDGDMAEALLLSYRHLHTNDPRLYYYATTSRHLGAQYSRLWKRAAEQIDIEVPELAKHEQPAASWVGSAAVPRLRSIRATVDAMKDRAVAVAATRGRRTAEHWMEIHNTLTVYVIRQIQWMTGIRAVRDPIELHLYVPKSGFLGVIDKDSKDEYGARLVWLVEPVQQQIQSYLHRVELATRSIFGKATQAAAFRFIGKKRSILHINQRLLARHAPDYPYAPNSHRHYMRSRLREMGVDGGMVDAWMGHGGIGREPYARHSAISPESMRQAIAPALRVIWDEIGWEVLPRAQA